MGITVNAHLGYGVYITDEQYDDLPWAVFESDGDDPEADELEEDGDAPKEPKPSFEDWITQLAGLVDPSAHIVDRDAEWKAWYEKPANKEAMGTYWDQKREAEKNCSIKVIDVSTGDSGDPCILLAVRSTVTLAGWAEPTPAITTLDEEALAAALEFCAQHNIPFESPQWFLTAEYGG